MVVTLAKHAPFARACQGEAVAVPAMARWVREARQVVVLDGCFLRCQARLMRRMLGPDQLIEIDALPLDRTYVDLFRSTACRKRSAVPSPRTWRSRS